MNERTLERIMAILVSLSVIAARAADRSFPVRFLALVILRRAEAVACALLAGAFVPLDGGEEAPERGFDPADALLLAARFRLLAAALGALLSLARGDSHRVAGSGAAAVAITRFRGQLAAPMAAGIAGPNDTS